MACGEAWNAAARPNEFCCVNKSLFNVFAENKSNGFDGLVFAYEFENGEPWKFDGAPNPVGDPAAAAAPLPPPKFPKENCASLTAATPQRTIAWKRGNK